MADASITPRLPFWKRLFFAVPVIGWVARDVEEGGPENLYYAVALFVMLWILSVVLFGLPGLYVPAVLMVPGLWFVLILISRG